MSDDPHEQAKAILASGRYAPNRNGSVAADDYRDEEPEDEQPEPKKPAPRDDADKPSELPRLWSALDLNPAAPARWLAKGRLPVSAITLLVGDEGIGKSLMWVFIVAHVTTGKPCPEFGIPARDPGRVIVAVTEDDWTTEVRSRLEVAGADLSMIDVICTDRDGSGSPLFPRDLYLIREADPAPVLVVVDAWLDTVPGSLNVRDGQQARLALHPWKELATAIEAAVLLVCHTNRAATANPRDKYGITSELRKKARMTLFAQKNDNEQFVIGPEKANTTAPLPASLFQVNAVQVWEPTDDCLGTVGKLVYVGESDQTAREHLADSVSSESVSGSDDVLLWLNSQLDDGPQWKADIAEAAKKAGYSDKKLRGAKVRLHAEAHRSGGNGSWFWRLPKHTGVPDNPVSPVRASGASGECGGHLGASGDSQIPLSSSQDVHMPSSTRYVKGGASGKCDCGEPLIHPASVERGCCEECHLNRDSSANDEDADDAI